MSGEQLVLTHDTLVQGVHVREDEDPADIAWKLVAVNLSDLAAKGAAPVGVLVSHMLGDADERFVAGLREVLETYATPLLGGDTVRADGRRVWGCTAIGRATHTPVPDRRSARGSGRDARIAAMCSRGSADPREEIRPSPASVSFETARLFRAPRRAARPAPGPQPVAPAAAAVCCGLVCAVIYPVLATSDAVWGAVCVSTLVIPSIAPSSARNSLSGANPSASHLPKSSAPMDVFTLKSKHPPHTVRCTLPRAFICGRYFSSTFCADANDALSPSSLHLHRHSRAMVSNETPWVISIIDLVVVVVRRCVLAQR